MKRQLLCAAVLCVFVAAPSMAEISVTAGVDADTLVSTILGSGVTVSNISYTGTPAASGTFTGGMDAGINIPSGIVLTSGWASNITGTNTSDAKTGDNQLPGDSDLGALVPQTTYDATVLEFDFESEGGDIFFNYVFASEEYNEYTNTNFNDVFGFFLNGENIALIPGTDIPVSVNNVNGGNPLGTNASYPEYYNNNDLSDGGPFYDFEYDGFTNVFTAKYFGLTQGLHHIKLAIADSGDYVLDSGVFIQAGTFSDQPTPVIPVPGAALLGLLGLGTAGMRLRRRTA